MILSSDRMVALKAPGFSESVRDTRNVFLSEMRG